MKRHHPQFFTFLLIISISIPNFGQSDTYRIADLYTMEDGMSHNYITCLEKFKIGIIVIGTQNGLLIYDGYDFELVNSDSTSHPQLNDNYINSLSIDQRQNVWVATRNGVDKANPFITESERFFNLGNLNYPPLQTEHDSESELTISSDGDIWMINNGLICRLIDGKVKEYFPELYTDVSKIYSDKKNNIYALTKDYLIGIASDGSLLFEIDEFISPEFGLQKRENWTKLFSTKEGEIIIEDFNNQRYFKVNEEGGIEDLTSGNHWLPKMFQAIDEQISQYNIKSIKKNDILETNYNLVWVATDFGLLKIEVNHQYFKTIPELEGISSRALVKGKDGVIYGGTSAPNQFFTYNSNNNKFKWINNNQDVTDLVSLNQDSILVISEDGEIRIFSQAKQEVVSKINSPDGNILKTVFRDNNDTLWFGAKRGLYQSNIYNPLNISKAEFPKGDIIEGNLIRDICQIDDNTFLLASNNGIIEYHKKSGTQIIFDEKSPKYQRVLNNTIGQFTKDNQGNIWVGTDRGLNFLDVEEMKITKSFTNVNGLCNDLVYSMILEGDTILWIGSAYGLSKFDIKNESFINYFRKEGIADNEFIRNSFLKSKNGKIYLGGIKGVTIIDSKNISFKKPLGSHYIIRYLKYNSSTGMINKYFLNPQNIKPIYQKPNESFIELHFVNVDLTSSRRNNFSYILEGAEENWVPWTNENKVRFSNLEPGDYVFKLKSSNANGVKNNYIFKVPIIVEQYFYKSKWFIILIGLVALISLIVFFQYRFYQYQKTIRLRNELARDLHDDMSNSFNNIRIIAKESNPENIEKTTEDMYHIHNMSSEAIETVEDVIWSINRDNQTVGHVIMKMEDFLDDVLRSKNIPFTFEKFGIDEEDKLNYLYRRNLLLIFKEAITNTIKHSKPLHVHIIFKDQPKTLRFQITNVFDELVQAKYSTGLGIPGMRERAEFINATLEIKKAKHQFDIVMIMKKVKKKGRKKR